MAEGSDYTPGNWAGHDFASARAHYDVHAGRSYDNARTTNVSASDLVAVSITTNTPHPLIIQCDVTGSMSGWPNTIFSKLPYLDHEMRTEYLSEDAEVCFGAISDTGDSYPFQIQPFAKGTKMKEALEKLVITDGGTGPEHYCEAYSIAALYSARNIQMPLAIIKPILIMIGDEKPYHLVSRNDAKNAAKVDLESSLTAEQIFRELMEKYSVYLIQKPYGSSSFGGDELTGVTREIHERWVGLIGKERIAFLPEAGRVVDVIFGILAHEAGRSDYFRKELEGRQKAGQVKTVYTALRTIHEIDKHAGRSPGKKDTKLLPAHGKSTLHRPLSGKKGDDLG